MTSPAPKAFSSFTTGRLIVSGIVLALFATLPARSARADGLTARLTIPTPKVYIGGPAVEPAWAFSATFELTNDTSSPVRVNFPDRDAAKDKIIFELFDESGDLLWISGEVAAVAEPVMRVLPPGKSWRRTVNVPVFQNSGQLPIGRYQVVASLAGTPTFRAAAWFEMTDDPAAAGSAWPPISVRPPGLITSLSVDDTKVNLSGRPNVRLSGVVNAEFTLANRTVFPIAFEFSDSLAAQLKIKFRLYNGQGTLLWQSDSDLITLPVVVSGELGAGETWSRAMPVPLHLDGTALPAGSYTLVGTVDGFPDFSAEATIRIVR